MYYIHKNYTDPIVQSAGNTQNYNRYSYVLNNPLKYTDPSGYYTGHPQFEGEYKNNWGAFSFAFTRVQSATLWRYRFNYNTGEYERFNVYGSESATVSYEEVFDNFIAPNATDITNNVMSLVASGSRDITINIGNGGIEVIDTKDFFIRILKQLALEKELDDFLSSLLEESGYGMRYDGGEAGGGDGLTLSETETMATVMGWTNTFTRGLIDWGLRQATTPWGNSINGFNKFSKGSGKFLGYYSGFVYGMQARNAYNNGDRLHTLSNGLMSFYSLVATKGGTPGLVFTAPFFVIDWTVGMDNFLLYNFNYGIEQSIQIQNGNWGVSLWRPGQGLR